MQWVRAVAGASVLGLVACNAILGIEEPEHKADAAASGGATSGGGGTVSGGGTSFGGTGGAAASGGTGGSGGMGGTGGIGGTGGGVAGSAGADSGPSCTTHSVDVSADSAIFSGACNGSIVYGGGTYGNIGAGRGLLRFTLGSGDDTALIGGQVQSLTLKLSRNVDCEGDANACGGTAKTGQFQFFPLRNDWTEGDGSTYSGADWCRRTAQPPNGPWNAPGANNDHGSVAATVSIDAATNSVDIPLDPSTFDASWVTNNQISILVIPASGAGFVYATRESAMYAHPKLEICR